MKRISRLHFITTTADHAEQACRGGAEWVQLRLKNVPYDEHRRIALEVQDVCRRYNAVFIVNDNVALAADIKADGVHIGKEDMPPGEARQLLGRGYIIGCTANTVEDIRLLAGENIDYIGLGPYRFTGTKQNLSPLLGLDGYVRILDRIVAEGVIAPPVIGIGGIAVDDVAHLLRTGLHGIAVSGAIDNSEDVSAAAKAFRQMIDNTVLIIA